MRVTVRELAALQAVPPQNVALYLAAHGWRTVDERPGLFSLWTHPESATSRALAPSSQNLGDYALRIQQLLESLERFENRSQAEILSDLFMPYSDVFRVRHTADGWPSDTIFLDAAAELVFNARRLVLAAASAAARRQATYAPRKPESAESYIKRVRMGHTERGSFVITIISPIFISGSLFQDREQPEPFERRVTRTLFEAVDAAIVAALESERLQDLSPFKGTLEKGVSANLCDALVGLEEKTGAVDVDLSMAWAPGRDLPIPNVPNTIRVPSKALPALKEASRELKDAGSEAVLLRGAIIHLHSEWKLQRSDSATASEITVAGYIDGDVRKVNVTLPMDDYLRAVEAHKNGQLVRMRGLMERAGRSWVLLHPYDLTFEDD
jgi:hypothetical protein